MLWGSLKRVSRSTTSSSTCNSNAVVCDVHVYWSSENNRHSFSWLKNPNPIHLWPASAKSKQIKSCLSGKLAHLPDWVQLRWPNVTWMQTGTVTFLPICSTSSLPLARTPLSAELIQASGQLFALLCMSFPYHCAGSSVSCKCSPKLGGKVNLAWPKALLDDGLSAIVLHANGATKPCELPWLPITRRCWTRSAQRWCRRRVTCQKMNTKFSVLLP